MKGLRIASRIVALATVMSLVAAPGYAQRDSKETQCEAAKQKIQRLRSKMRQGYTARQGIRMDDEMRRLKKLRSEHCR
jgi:predicted DNA-binding protein (UPF0278 family)